ncbi:uncharacterized protein K441DRAFT_38750 [Cenococcum geophilum 1.58]|uniref:uncharacterized protein n=1 Tax=Cenococcum geophilum 1.58 TaxID=794803 RepID=UPI00358F1B84|nr:hypothetical protein K441DRAFT_38750 [Cenococcum geophilum 1.58]
MSFRWPMKVTGLTITAVAGLRFRQRKEEPLIPCRMGCSLGLIHQLFDIYDFSINPDDNYKIMFFMPNYCGFAGKHLDQRFLNNPQRPLDQLLRWHFRQAVLANMRGAGEPIFEHGFPPGSDVVGDILYGPKAAERMEFELFSRLGAQVELFPAAGQDGGRTIGGSALQIYASNSRFPSLTEGSICCKASRNSTSLYP